MLTDVSQFTGSDKPENSMQLFFALILLKKEKKKKKKLVILIQDMFFLFSEPSNQMSI